MKQKQPQLSAWQKYDESIFLRTTQNAWWRTIMKSCYELKLVILSGIRCPVDETFFPRIVIWDSGRLSLPCRSDHVIGTHQWSRFQITRAWRGTDNTWSGNKTRDQVIDHVITGIPNSYLIDLTGWLVDWLTESSGSHLDNAVPHGSHWQVTKLRNLSQIHQLQIEIWEWIRKTTCWNVKRASYLGASLKRAQVTRIK